VKAVSYEGVNIELILTTARFTLHLDYICGENEDIRHTYDL
jgi:hypothetical protein